MKIHEVQVVLREKDGVVSLEYLDNFTSGVHLYLIPKEEVPEKLKVAMALADLAGEDVRFHHKFSLRRTCFMGRAPAQFYTDTGYRVYLSLGEVEELVKPFKSVRYSPDHFFLEKYKRRV